MKKHTRSKTKESEKDVKKVVARKVSNPPARAASPYDVKAVIKELQHGGTIARRALAWMQNTQLEFSPINKGSCSEPPPSGVLHTECVITLTGGIWQVWMEHDVRSVLLNPPGTPIGMGFNVVSFEGSIFDTTINLALADSEPEQVARLEALHRHLQDHFYQMLDQSSRSMPSFPKMWNDAHHSAFRISVTTGKTKSSKRTIKPEKFHRIPQGQQAEAVVDASASELLEICLQIEVALKEIECRTGMEPNPDCLTLDPVGAVQFGLLLGSLMARADAVLAYQTFANVLKKVGRSDQELDPFWKWVQANYMNVNVKEVFGMLNGCRDPANPSKTIRLIRNQTVLVRHNGKRLKLSSFESKLRLLRAKQKLCNTKLGVAPG
jgi:hypothetical protein